MKKLFCVLFIAGLLNIPSYSQVILGAGYVNQSLSEFNPHLLNGFYVGGGYSIAIGNRFAVTPGLYYLRAQGGLYGTGNLWLSTTQVLPPMDLDEKEYFRNNTLALPVQVSFSVVSSPAFKLFIFGGPSISFELNTSYEYSCSIGERPLSEVSCKDLIAEDNTIQPNIDYSRWSIGIGGGIGMDIFKHYRITAGYEYGLNDRLKGREYLTLQDDKSMHTQRIYAGLAYVF